MHSAENISQKQYRLWDLDYSATTTLEKNGRYN